ncbi:cupin domain protein [Glonium stellatum]|uniref:Cupin domain protein n=1 Tax=Glonium stellatum TaxID=574774 RepID=A0A8E2EZA2_9PEZI|nr:cupin domain protein [Glonium stellatum]
MSVPRVSVPPSSGGSYVIPQLEGEIISIPGSKNVFRILTSAMQTDGTMSVFSSGGVLADAPGFHHHNEAHDIFIVTKGYLQLWNGDRCKILGPGDFASIPPGIIHNPMWLGPHSETFGLITPAEWIDFFRYITEPYSGILFPEFDNRNLVEILIPKVMAAKGKYDVIFHPEHRGCAVTNWSAEDEKIPDRVEPYYLRANTGPRWLLGGVMSRPFITTKQSNNKFAITSIESSSMLDTAPFNQNMTFPNVHHCFTVFEGALEVLIAGSAPCKITEGETLFIAANTRFSLKFSSKFVRFWSFTSGDGIEALIHEAGQPFKGFVIPDKAELWEESKFKAACEKFGVSI